MLLNLQKISIYGLKGEHFVRLFYLLKINIITYICSTRKVEDTP